MPDSDHYHSDTKPQRYIVRVQDTDAGDIIRLDEAIRFLAWLKRRGFMQYRLLVGVMLDGGLRSAEACRLTLANFRSVDYRDIRYVVRKPKKRTLPSGTQSVIFKRRPVTFCPVLAREMQHYAENYLINSQDTPDVRQCRKYEATSGIPKDYLSRIFMYQEVEREPQSKRLFGFDENAFRRYLANWRDDARAGRMDDAILAAAILEEKGETMITVGTQTNTPYRIHMHCFRHFYITYCYYIKYGHPDPEYLSGDWVRTQDDIGHDLDRTTRAYIERPENVGITPKVKRIWQKYGNNILFGGGFDIPLIEF
jgi:integrase